MSTIQIKSLGPENAHQLAPLIAQNAQALKRGAPRRPDDFYAEIILADKNAELTGAFEGDQLVGFAVFFDLPEMITGLRIGQLENIYVLPEFRNKGIARKMIEALEDEGKKRGWLHLRWLVSSKDTPSVALYEKIAEPDDFKSFIIKIDRTAGE